MENIIHGMARAMWVSWFAGEQDRLADCEGHAGRGAVFPSPGQNWDDVAPETPRDALDQAWRLCGCIECINNCNIFVIYNMAIEADARAGHVGQAGQFEFGWCMAMEAMGHGVSWFDDHADFSIKFPFFEFEYVGG